MSKPRYIETSFPIVQINPLSARERNAFPPIYKMHKWFARRSPSIFRAIILASCLPHENPHGRPLDIMEEFYRGHADDPRLKDNDDTALRILDPFMGGGTTVVEALRLGLNVTGIDYNPIAWFIVKGQTTQVDIDQLKSSYDALAETTGRKILEFYSTPCPVTGSPADIIYAFWVKEGICVDPQCNATTDLFRSYVVGRIQGDLGVRFIPDSQCPACQTSFDLELQRCTITAGGPQVLGEGAGGKRRPRGTQFATVSEDRQLVCPGCGVQLALDSVMKSGNKAQKKKVLLQVLLDPSTGDLFECRGSPPATVTAPSGYTFDPKAGTTTAGKFDCIECGRTQRVVDSARAYGAPLPFRMYAFYAHTSHTEQDHDSSKAARIRGLPTNNFKWFARPTANELKQFRRASDMLEELKDQLPLPVQEIYDGYNTNRLVIHQYKRWRDLYNDRQLLCLGLLLQAISRCKPREVRDKLLGAFQRALDFNSKLNRYNLTGNKIEGATSAHDFRNPTTVVENSVWGIGQGQGGFRSTYLNVEKGVEYALSPQMRAPSGRRISPDTGARNWSPDLRCASVRLIEVESRTFDAIVTDPPYAGSVQYAEMSDWSYVWLHQVLKDDYDEFEPALSLKSDEFIENGAEKDADWFFENLTAGWRECHRVLKDDGLLVFTFHHKEGDRWLGLLRSLFEAGFYLVTAYPTHSEALNSIVIQATKGITYDIIHVCRKRPAEVEEIPWTLLRRQVQREARQQLKEIEGGQDVLPGPDVWMILLARALHLFSQHYEKVIDFDGSVLELEEAMARLRILVREIRGESLPLPGSLEDADGLTKIYFLHIAGKTDGWTRDGLHIELRGYGHSPDDLARVGLIRQPRETNRWETVPVLERAATKTKGSFALLVDRLHQLLGLAAAGESVEPSLKHYRGWPLLIEGLRYLGKCDEETRELCELVIRTIESLGPEDEARSDSAQLELFGD